MIIPEETLWARTRSIVRSIRRSPYPMRRLASLALKRSHMSRVLRIRAHGLQLRFFPTSLSAHLWTNPNDRLGDIQFLERYLRPGDIVVDAGANIGLLALAAAQRVRPHGLVVAIEPHPRTFAYMQANIHLNPELAPCIRPVHAAIGERSGITTFSSQGQDDQNHVTADGGVRIPMRRLEEMVPAQAPIALLKLDVEGYELPALLGAMETLPRVACVYFEFYAPFFASFGYTLGDLLDLLHAVGFQVFQEEHGRLQKVTAANPPQGIVNLLAVRDVAALCARTGWVEA